MTKPYDVVAAGHICLDVIPDLGEAPAQKLAALLRPGQLVEVGRAAISTGGPVSNTGLAMHALGMRTRLMGKVGDDLFGQAVRQIVTRHGEGLAEGMVVDPEVATSYTLILSPPGVDRVFLHCPGANDTFTAADVRYAVVADARLFHFGYPPLMQRFYQDQGEELATLYRQVKARGVTTSLDMAVPDPTSAAGRADWDAILRRALPHVDVFLPSVEECLYMLRRRTSDELMQRAEEGERFLDQITPDLLSDLGGELLAMGGKIVGLKLGDRGLYVRTATSATLAELGAARPSDLAAWADRELWSPCFQVDVVGTTGAGDATIAGFLSALLRDEPLARAVTMAVAVGACNVEAADALGGIRPWEATVARVAEGWAKHPLHLDAPGWRHDAEAQLWARDARGGSDA